MLVPTVLTAFIGISLRINLKLRCSYRAASVLNRWMRKRSAWFMELAQEQYEELLRLAEEYLKQGFIDRDERKRLVLEATQRYAQAVEGVGEGT
jgi:hypothetical protein